MKALPIELVAGSPLAIRADHAPGGTETAKYIPGSTLRGSLAATHRLLRPGEDAEFAVFFLSGAIQYPHLYPASFKDAELEKLHIPVYPLPQTAQSCKRYPGFFWLPGERGKEERHGVRDSLLDWAMFRLLETPESTYSEQELQRLMRPLEEHKHCTYQVGGAHGQARECGEPLDHWEGYYSRGNLKGQVCHGQAYVNTRLQTHTGINRERGVVEERILYSSEVIEEDMRFWGLLKVSDELAPAFEQFMSKVQEEDWIDEKKRKEDNKFETHGLVRIGTGRTRGMGKVYVRLEKETNLDKAGRYQDFTARLQAFQNALCQRARRLELPEIKRFYFALTLHAPAIVLDDWLRYCGTISGATLGREAGIAGQNAPFKLLHQAANVRRVTGWQEVWGTPKTNEYAIESGSIFLYSCVLAPGQTLPDEQTLLRPLFELEEQGLGKRCEEGFGRICFSDPFHVEEHVL